MTILVDVSQRSRVLEVVRNETTDYRAKVLVKVVRRPSLVALLSYELFLDSPNTPSPTIRNDSPILKLKRTRSIELRDRFRMRAPEINPIRRPSKARRHLHPIGKSAFSDLILSGSKYGKFIE